MIFGIQQNEENTGVEGAGGSLVKQLDESNKTLMKQQMAMDILAQFGFQ